MAYPLLLHGRHGDATVYETVGAWIVPWHAGAAEQEYGALRHSAALIDYSTQALLRVEGPDRAAFLHNLLTNDIKRLTPGTGCHAALLNVNAKLIGELIVLADAEALWLLCDASRAALVHEALERHHFSEAVTLTNLERSHVALALQGPRAFEAARALSPALPDLIRPGDHALQDAQGVMVRWVRWSLADVPGWLCLAPAEEAKRLWDALQQRGASAGLRVAGWQALNTARIEAGVPWFGVDFDDTHLLPETGLERTAVSDAKGCYLGQEIVARLGTYGSVSKKLVGILLEGARVPPPGAQLFRQSDDVGHITSACLSPRLKRAVALGWVKRGAYEAGTPLDVVVDGARIPATVSAGSLARA